MPRPSFSSAAGGTGAAAPTEDMARGSWPRGAGGEGQLWDGDPLASVFLQLWDAAVDEMGTLPCVGNAAQEKESNPQGSGVLVGWGCMGERRWNRRAGGLLLGEGLIGCGGLWGRDGHGSGPLWLNEKTAWPSIH